MKDTMTILGCLAIAAIAVTIVILFVTALFDIYSRKRWSMIIRGYCGKWEKTVVETKFVHDTIYVAVINDNVVVVRRDTGSNSTEGFYRYFTVLANQQLVTKTVFSGHERIGVLTALMLFNYVEKITTC